MKKLYLLIMMLCLLAAAGMAQNVSTSDEAFRLYEQACKDQNLDDVLRYGELYVNVGGEEKIADVVYTISKVYAWKNDTVKVNYWYEYLKQYSEENDDLLDEELIRLQHDTQELLDANKWKEEIVGSWVRIDNTKHPQILTILNTAESNGARYLWDGDVIPIKEGKMISFAYPSTRNISQGLILDGKNKTMALQFSSEPLKDNTWKTDIASIGIDATQNLRANFDATILTSDGTIGEKIGATLVTGLLTAGLENIFRDMTYSYRSYHLNRFFITQKNSNVLDAKVSYWHKYVDNTGRNEESNGDYETTFVRWEEEDSIVFISGNNKPITLTPVDKNDALLDEYHSIMRKTSFWRVSTFASVALGGLLAYLGLPISGDILGLGMVGSALLTTVGAVELATVPVVIWYARSSSRVKLIKQMNLRNMEKLRRKADVELSFSPSYNPVYDAMGAGVNIKF